MMMQANFIHGFIKISSADVDKHHDGTLSIYVYNHLVEIKVNTEKVLFISQPGLKTIQDIHFSSRSILYSAFGNRSVARQTGRL